MKKSDELEWLEDELRKSFNALTRERANRDSAKREREFYVTEIFDKDVHNRVTISRYAELTATYANADGSALELAIIVDTLRERIEYLSQKKRKKFFGLF